MGNGIELWALKRGSDGAFYSGSGRWCLDPKLALQKPKAQWGYVTLELDSYELIPVVRVFDATKAG